MGYTIWPDGPAGDALSAIFKERIRQEDLKTKGKFKFSCADVELTHPQRLSVLVEEVGEVGHEVNEEINQPLDVLRLKKELIQVAAVCVAWLEALEVLK
jgi:NTP pyrophosphatase (non-canonical NTP hydrolase)